MGTENWPRTVRVQHWFTVMVMVICIAAIWGHELFDKTDPLRSQFKQVHFALGGLVGLLTVPRLLTKFFVPQPVHPMPHVMALATKVAHISLYLLMLLLPVCGYVAVSGKGVPIDLLGLVEIAPLPVGKDVAKGFKELHEGLGNALIGLVALHVGAVIFHVVILKDRVLDSMLGKAAD